MHIHFSVARRSSLGAVTYETAGGHAPHSSMVYEGEVISFNVAPASITSYQRDGSDLVIHLVDGQVIVLFGWFNEAGEPIARLYLSSDGMISEVLFTDTGYGVDSAGICVPLFRQGAGSLNGLIFDSSDPFANWIVAERDSLFAFAFPPSLLAAGAIGLGAAALLGGNGNASSGGSGQNPDFPRFIDGGGTTLTLTQWNAPPSLPVSGTGVPGEVITVHIGNVSRTATVAPDGRWSVLFDPSDMPPDGSYTATATFRVGASPVMLNGATFVMNLDPPPLSVSEGFKSNGDVENALEYADGVTLRGTTEPGSMVNVTLGVPGQPNSVTRSATVNADGTWSVTFLPSEIDGGEREQVVTISSTDRSGQSTVLTEVVVLDTIAPQLTIRPITGDDFASRNEVNSPVMIEGVAAPGSVVRLQVEGVPGTFTVTADAGGIWSIILPAGTFPAGDYARQVTATTTDPAGNTTTTTRRLVIDTVSPSFSAENFGAETGDDEVLNGRERAAGLPISGTAEPGTSVSITINGNTQTGTAGPDGKWTVTFPAEEIPQGQISAVPFSAIARDPAGNTTGPFSSTFQVDTTPPLIPAVLETQDVAGGMRGVSTAATTDEYQFFRIDITGPALELPAQVTQDDLYNETVFRFQPGQIVPDGSYLLISNADQYGNEANVLLIKNTTTGVAVDLSRQGIQGFELLAIDLTRAPDARVTISAAQLEALVGPDKQLFVIGDASDTVTLQNVSSVQENATVNGRLYDIYTLGSNGAQVLIEDDVSKLII
jgi:large repetitive protein